MLPRVGASLVRLVDAEPHWVIARARGPGGEPLGLPIEQRSGMGITFQCPIHGDTCFIGVMFSNPIDGGPPDQYRSVCGPAPEYAVVGWKTQPLWQRTGVDFATLTISPSIRVLGGPRYCEWHGFIRNGLFEHCGDAK